MEQTLAEFKVAQKQKTPKVRQKVNNSWGVYDYYKYYRTHRPDKHEYVLYESVYFSIIRSVNKMIVDELCRTGSFTFPFKLGKIEVRQLAPRTYIKDGKARTSRPIDWDTTLELWYNDPQSYKDKTLIYQQEKDFCVIRYNNFDAVYKNKAFYNFTPMRDVKERVREAYRSGILTPVSIFGKKELNQIKGLYDD